MYRMQQLVAGALVATLAMAHVAAGQDLSNADIWRAFAMKTEVGTELTVRLTNGQRFRATLVDAREAAIALQPKTRVPVPVQQVPYGTIASLERQKEGGMGAGKATAIGVATGVGAFFASWMILLAVIDD
jgi:hypothetical protein